MQFSETFSEETLMAYVDGEAAAADRTAIEQALLRDPQLAERIARHRRLRSQLASAFGGVVAEPVPQRLTERAQHAPSGGPVAAPPVGNVVAGAPRWFDTARRRTQQWSWPEWSALAASLLLGVLASRTWLDLPSAPLTTVAGQVLASGELAKNLSQLPGGTRDTQSNIAVGLSYLAQSGNYCRTFELPGIKPLAGIACREAAQWRVQALLPAPAQDSTQYRMAGSALPPALLNMVDAERAEEPLDAEAETAVRARGWQR
jgi:hypothetical protein